MLTGEIASATTSAEYLTQKRAWVEDRLGVARLLSLFSPAGHSLVSWAAACGQTEIVEILMSHGATAELGDETRAVSASIIQVHPCAGMRLWVPVGTCTVWLVKVASGWCGEHLLNYPYRKRSVDDTHIPFKR